MATAHMTPAITIAGSLFIALVQDILNRACDGQIKGSDDAKKRRENREGNITPERGRRPLAGIDHLFYILLCFAGRFPF